jgi:excisionase family DNA binding protein
MIRVMQDAKQPGTSDVVNRRYLTIDELAAQTGFSVSTLRRLWRRGRISGFQPGGRRTRVVFLPNAVEGIQVKDLTTADGSAGSENPLPGPRPRWLAAKA